MIKLVIDSQSEKEQDYITAIKGKVVKRIDYLQSSINHLEKEKIDLSKLGTSAEIVMRNAIGIIEGKEFKTKDDFKDDQYKATVESYLAAANKLSTVDFKLVKDLLKDLTDNNAKKLEDVLICPPEGLFDLNADMMSGLKKDSKELKLLKLIFDYDNIASISSSIRSFFKESNFINYCPYCNMESAAFVKSENGNGAASHELDHYFCQATYPFLSYSFFNLVPSGTRCNSPLIKGSIVFTREFNINPYTEGFGLSARFKPIKPTPKSFEVKFIDIEFNCEPDSVLFKQLLGEKSEIDDGHKKGNVNIFKLRALYNDEEHLEDAEDVLKSIHKAHIGHRSIKKYFDMMRKKDQTDDYLEWYKGRICKVFYSDEFGKRRNAKFFRDIHDSYFIDKSLISSTFRYVYRVIENY